MSHKTPKEIVLSDEVIHYESEYGYGDALSHAVGAGSYHGGSDCTVNVIISGLGYANGKFCITIHIIVTGPDPKAKDEEEEGGDSRQQQLDREEEEKQDNDFEWPDDPEVKQYYHLDDNDFRPQPKYQLLSTPDPVTDYRFNMSVSDEKVLMEFNNATIDDRLTTNLENTWEVNPESELWSKIKERIDENLRASPKPEPVEPAPTPEPTPEPPQEQEVERVVKYKFHSAELNISKEEDHLIRHKSPSEVKALIRQAAVEKYEEQGIEPPEQELVNILSIDEMKDVLRDEPEPKPAPSFDEDEPVSEMTPTPPIPDPEPTPLENITPDIEPAPVEYKEMRIFTEEMDRLEDLVPEHMHFGLELVQHLHEKGVEDDVKMKIEAQLKQAMKQVPGLNIQFTFDEE